jgi:hypothetical protein
MIYFKSKVYPEVFIKIGFQFHYMVFHIVKRTSCFTIYVHGARTLIIKTFSIKTFGITKLRAKGLVNDTEHK